MNILIPWVLSMLLGIFVGGAPGLTATMAVALIVPLTFHMTPAAGLAIVVQLLFEWAERAIVPHGLRASTRA